MLVALLAAGASRSAPNATAEPAGASRLAEVRARNAAMEERFRAGDLRGVAAFYADDGVLLAPGGARVEGRAAIDAYWARFTEPVDWRLTVDGLEGGDDLLVQRGTSRLVRRRDGVEHVSEVRFVLVWVRQADGILRIAVDAYW